MKNKENFNKNFRLLNKAEFDLLYKSGKRIILKNFIVFVKRNTYDTARLGLSFSKKRVPKACMRNRIKRIFRESFRLHRQSLNNFDVIVTIRNSEVVNLPNQNLFPQADELWKSLKKQSS